MICPFCSLLCDGTRDVNDCSLRAEHLLRTRSRPIPGEVSEGEIAKARKWITEASSIMISGRLASVESSRAVLSFANQHSAIVDCSYREVTMDTATAISRTGTCSISLAEVRDLSDVIIVLGDDRLLDQFPKLADCLSKVGRSTPIILLGEHTPKSIEAWSKFFANTWSIQCDIDRIPEALHSFFALRTSRHSEDVSHELPSTTPCDELCQASYVSIVWAPSSMVTSLADSGGRSAWIERLFEHQVEWNEKRRVGTLTLSGQDAVFQQVCLWTTGYPGRVSFSKDSSEFDPHRNSVRRWIAEHKDAPDSVLIELDETANHKNEWLQSLASGFLGRRIIVNSRSIADSERGDAVVYFPAQIAGYDHQADLLRADQVVLARVNATHENLHSAQTLSQWMEALSK